MTTEEANKPVILVTAGSAGLGAAASRLFARNGYRVAVNYNSNAERADKLVGELSFSSSSSSSFSSSGGEDFVAIRADLASRDDVVRLVKETVERLGGKGGRLDAIFS